MRSAPESISSVTHFPLMPAGTTRSRLCTSSGIVATTTRSQLIGSGEQALTNASSNATIPSRASFIRVRLPLAWLRSKGAAAPTNHRPQPQPQRVQLDKSLGVELVIGALVFLERHDAGVIQAVRRLTADTGNVALI